MKVKIVVYFALSFLSATIAKPHDINTSYTELSILPDEQKLVVNLTLDVSDLSKLFQLDFNEDSSVAKKIFLGHREKIIRFYSDKLLVVALNDTVVFTKRAVDLFEDKSGNKFVRLTNIAPLSEIPWSLELSVDIFSEMNPFHKNLVKIEHAGEVQQAILTRSLHRQRFLFSGQGIPFLSKFYQFLKLGGEHIFLGYDHILFLLALILIGGSFGSILKIVTAFTLAHSVTLSLAALNIMLLPGKLVEATIALSIIYIAVENFIVSENNQRWIITFIFGLMHGFGFARVVSGLGLPIDGMAISLFAFNVGVELGQLLILAALYPLIILISKSANRRGIVRALSSVILVFGLVWFIERVFEVEIPLI